MEVQNPHDKFFKETLGRVDVAKDFLNNYLPQSVMNFIDMDTLEPQKDSFIEKKLKDEYSDLLYKTKINKKEGYIYFLFEHKSYISRDITFQLLKYMIAIWEAKIIKEKTKELPVIIPLVIYHGKDKWNIKTSLRELIPGYKELTNDIQRFIPDYEYLLYDLSGYTDEEIKGSVQLRIFLTVLRDIFTKDTKGIIESILTAAKYLGELEDKQTGIEYFETLIRYIFNARADITTDDVNKIINKVEIIYPEGSEVIMTLADKLREEGEIKGEIKGKKETLKKMVIKLLTKRFGSLPDDIEAEISNADLDILERIVEDILELQSLDDVRKYLK